MPYTLEEVSEKLEENIPSMSATTTKVMELANDINSPPAELTRVIKLDPILSAKVMKLVNSSYFGLSNKIVSLEKAIILLGLNTIKNLALSAAVLAQVENKDRKSAFSSNRFWAHSLATGAAAKLIAQKRGVEKKVIEDYFIAGMLHDLGILVEDLIYPEEIKRIITAAVDVHLFDAEDIVLDGLNHCFIGKALGEKWHLSPDLIEVMLTHHGTNFSESPSELTMTVYVANIICNNNGLSVMEKTPSAQIEAAVLEKLGIEAAVEQEILAVLEGEIKKAMEFLKA